MLKQHKIWWQRRCTRGSFRAWTPFPLLKCLRTHCRRHCETFSGQNALDCRNFTHNIEIFPGATPPDSRRNVPGVWTQKLISARLASVPVVPVWRNGHCVMAPFLLLSVVIVTHPALPTIGRTCFRCKKSGARQVAELKHTVRQGSTENAGPELGGRNKTKRRNVRVENGGPILNTGKCRTGNYRTKKCRICSLKDHFTGLENAGPEREDQKESGWKLKDHSRS